MNIDLYFLRIFLLVVLSKLLVREFKRKVTVTFYYLFRD